MPKKKEFKVQLPQLKLLVLYTYMTSFHQERYQLMMSMSNIKFKEKVKSSSYIDELSKVEDRK